MSKCYICKRFMPDKNLSDVLESMQRYRERFPEDWDNEPPVIICIKCDQEIIEEENNE